MYHILVIGGGYLGTEIAKFFVEKKQKVWATTRKESRAKELEKQGILPLICELNNKASLESFPAAHFVVICPAPDERTVEAYQNIYIKGVGNFLKAHEKKPKPFLVTYISSTGVWSEDNGGIVDEFILPSPKTEQAKILLEAEKQILGSPYHTTVLRLSGIYGQRRNWIGRLREGKWPEPASDRYVNMIHVEDVARMLPDFFKNAQSGETYIGTDDEPVRRSEFCRWLAKQLDLAPPDYLLKESKVAGKRCLNQKLCSLGIDLKYPTYQEGYRRLLQEA